MTLLIQMEIMNTWLKVKSKVVWKIMIFLSSQLRGGECFYWCASWRR